jgi:hypothetical protein
VPISFSLLFWFYYDYVVAIKFQFHEPNWKFSIFMWFLVYVSFAINILIFLASKVCISVLFMFITLEEYLDWANIKRIFQDRILLLKFLGKRNEAFEEKN